MLWRLQHVSDVPYNKVFGSSNGEESTMGKYVESMKRGEGMPTVGSTSRLFRLTTYAVSS